MKRHPSLAHLSRDHHGALILARLLQKNAPNYNGLPHDIEEKLVYAVEFYNKELIKHFTEEEKALALVVGNIKKLDVLVETILHEHQQLHVLFKSLGNHSDILLAVQLDQLGKALETHVRKEERELFPLIEETCSDQVMEAINKALSSKF